MCGIRHDRIQQRLLSEEEGLTFEKAIQIAKSKSMESSIERANEIQSYQNSSMKMYTDFLKYNHDVVSVVVIVHISKKVAHLRKKIFFL